jgi:quinol monooxygenase YgiN
MTPQEQPNSSLGPETATARDGRNADIVIVAGHVTVEPQQRESYLAGCVIIVEQAREAAGCLDVAVTADLVDPGRVNIFERWESQAALEAFRRNGPPFEHGTAMLSVSVAEYDVADVRPLFRGGPRGSTRGSAVRTRENVSW